MVLVAGFGLSVQAAAQTPQLAPTQQAIVAPPPAALATDVSPTAAKSAAVQVTAKVLQPEPVFGSTVDLQVTLRYPKGYRVFFPGRPDVRPFLLLPDAGKSERTETPDGVTETITIGMLAARVGLQKTPALEVPWHAVTSSGGAGESGVALVPAQRVVVRSQFAAETDIKPAPLPLPKPLIEDNTPLQIGLLLLAAMGIAAALTWLGVRIADRRAALRVQKPLTPPHVTALQRLSELVHGGTLESAEPREVYASLSEILREYLGGRYGIAALDMTSSELLAALQSLDLRGVSLEQLQFFTEFGDLVKFARMPATAEELHAQHDFVRAVVEKTLQTPTELELIRKQEQERLARQRQLRLAVMASLPLRLLALGLDVLIGAIGVALLAWSARSSGIVWLWEVCWLVLPIWLAVRDALAGASPGKVLVGLQIAAFEDEKPLPLTPVWPPRIVPWDNDMPVVQEASMWSRLQRNLLFLFPVAGWLAEAATAVLLPEHRRLGEQWAQTRVIDGRHGMRGTQAQGWGRGAAVLAAAGLLLLVTWLQGEPDPRLAERGPVVVIEPPGSGPTAAAPAGAPAPAAPAPATSGPAAPANGGQP
jgi:hypothetical protein